jgi:hypothetical protein
MFKNETTEISPTGLRYVSKENGSPFQGAGSTGETISCIKCGKHKLRTRGVVKRYLNSLLFFCFDCKPVKHAAIKGAQSLELARISG